MARKNGESRSVQPGLWAELRCITAPMIDAVAVMLPGGPAQFGMRESARGEWRRGDWVGVLYVDKHGMDWTRASAAGECIRQPGFDWRWLEGEGARLARLDVARDVTGAPVCPEVLGRFAGVKGAVLGKSCEQYMQSQDGATVYVGNRRSPLMMRAYRKSTPRQQTPYLERLWRDGGWDGRSPVTRVEFEVKGRGLPGYSKRKGDPSQQWLFQVMTGHAQELAWSVWRDCLARRRMTAVPVLGYSQAQKCPTELGWMNLGDPEQVPREKVEASTSHLAQRLERLLRREGKRGMEPADMVGAFSAAIAALEDA